MGVVGVVGLKGLATVGLATVGLATVDLMHVQAMGLVTGILNP